MTVSLELMTHSPEETERVGRALAALLPPGSVVALRGDLASGKTCLVRGMASYFTAQAAVSSPTFTIVNEYGDSPKLYHLDLYRLESVEEIADLGVEELFESDGICVVEWAERAELLLPSRRLDIHLEHVGEDRRLLQFTDGGLLPENWRETLSSIL